MTRTILKPSLAKKVDDRFLSVSEVADYLGCDRITVQNMLRDGRLKASTLGPRIAANSIVRHRICASALWRW